ncbi:MAG TPA: LpqB family beta-propeller domain-containing protein, partial [Acidobacteriota bacterium]|nr:LpqB family beta-propeller domain-containing protein [Acidobacteriota bacterium]
GGTIYAYRPELDTWWESRWIRLGEAISHPPVAGGPAKHGSLWNLAWIARLGRSGKWLLAILPLALLGVAVGMILWRSGRTPTSDPVSVPRVSQFTSVPGRETSPAFSPDGRQLAFVWSGENDDNRDIYVKLVGEGHRPLRLTSNPANENYPAWSRDGQRLAFLRFSTAGSVVFVMPALGGKERKLAEVGSGGAGLSWSPDGKFLATSSRYFLQEAGAIFLISTATGEKHQVTSPPAGSLGDWWPRFSPGGESIAFARLPMHGVPNIVDLYVQSIAQDAIPDGAPRRVTFEGKMILGLDWSQDGGSLIFSSNRDGIQRLWRVAVPVSSRQEGIAAKPEPVSVGTEGAQHPSVARVGNLLAWVKQKPFDADLWRVDRSDPATKSEPPAEFAPSTRLDYSPHFSPDGKRVAFLSERSGTSEIWVCDSQGKGAYQVTNFGGSGYPGTPRWSPDGQEIAFDSAGEGPRDIYVVNAGGGVARRVTTEKSTDARPSWSADGKWIYFGSNRSGNWQVWKTAPSAGPAVQVTKQGGREAFESSDGRFVYYARGGEYGIWRIPVEGGEETLVTRQGRQSFWALGREGIFYIDFDSKPRSIKLFSFADQQLKLILRLPEGTRFESAPSLAVSPDGRRILYAGYKRLEGDILLADDFQ